MAVVIADRARTMFREEDVEALRNRISDGLKSLESTVSGIAEGITGSLSDAKD